MKKKVETGKHEGRGEKKVISPEFNNFALTAGRLFNTNPTTPSKVSDRTWKYVTTARYTPLLAFDVKLRV